MPPCENWTTRLSTYLDGEDTAPRAVEAHLEECESCRQWVAEVTRDREMVVSAFTATPRASFTSDIMTAIGGQPSLADTKPIAKTTSPIRTRLIEAFAGAAFVAALAILLAPIVSGARAEARSKTCLRNIQEVSVSMLQYASDHGQTLPPARTWDQDLTPYVRSVSAFQCPDAPSLPSFGYRPELAAVSLTSIADPFRTAVLYDGIGPQASAFARRHDGKGSVAYLSGSATQLPELPSFLAPRVGG